MNIIKAILVFTFINFHCFAGDMFDYMQRKYEGFANSDYAIETHDKFDFKACKEYEQEDPDLYYVGCRETQLKLETDFDEFAKNLEKIEREVLEEQMLRELKAKVIKDLNFNQGVLNGVESCLRAKESNPTCERQINQMLETVRAQLPGMRILMAQKDMPGHIYAPAKDFRRYNRKLTHEINDNEVKNLTMKEETYLKGHINRLTHDFEQHVLNKQNDFPIDGIENCTVTKQHGLKELKKTEECQHFKILLDVRVSRQFEKQNKKYQEAYGQVVSANPMLTLLDVSGDESDDIIKADILRAIGKLREDGQEVIDRVKGLEGDDRNELLSFNMAVEDYLNKNNSNRYLCDLAQDRKDDHDFDQLKTDLYIGAGALIGGGVCAFTYGFGCAIAVAVGFEGVAVGVSQHRLNKAQQNFTAGMVDTLTIKDREFERNLAVYLAPLALVGHGAGTVVKNVAEEMTEEVVEEVVEETVEEVVEEVVVEASEEAVDEAGRRVAVESSQLKDDRRYARRTNTAQREAVDNLEGELGPRKLALLNKYMDEPIDSLSHVDQVYFAGIADLLEKQMIKENPFITPNGLKGMVKEELDEIIKRCK